MLDRDIIRHAGEFKSYLDNHQYEVSDTGIEFPKASVMLFGEYEDNYGRTPNLITTEGLNHILSVALRDGSKLNNFYLTIFSGNYTPTAALTAAMTCQVLFVCFTRPPWTLVQRMGFSEGQKGICPGAEYRRAQQLWPRCHYCISDWDFCID